MERLRDFRQRAVLGQDVIRMNEPHDIPRRQPNALVDCVVQSPVFFGYPTDSDPSDRFSVALFRLGAANLLRIRANDIDRAIRRTAIDNDVFEREAVPSLPRDGLQCRANRRYAIPDNRDD